MVRCQYHQCAMIASYNVKEGGQKAVYCKLHAEDGMVNVSSKRCSHDSCMRQPNFNVEGSKTSAYCKEHARDGMVNVRNKRCSHASCTKRPCYNFVSSKTPAYCKQHAADGMVDVLSKRCLHESCLKQPSFNLEGSKTAAYCRKHAEDSMVNVVSKRCLHDTCQKRPTFGVKGSKSTSYCRKHAKDGMVNIVIKRCLHDSCLRYPYFNIKGSRTAIYCEQHAENGMVDIVSKRCLEDSCQQRPTHNVEGSTTAVYCKQHAKAGMVDYIIHKRCFVYSCTRKPIFNVVGSKAGAYCAQHAEDGMVDIVSRRCAHSACTKYASFSTKGRKAAIYCKQHAEDGMVDISSTRCVHASCMKYPSFNTKEKKKAEYCKEHAKADMVNVGSKRCSRDSCTRQPSFNARGSKTALYCKQHAEDGMVIIRKRFLRNDQGRTGPAQGAPTKVDHNVDGSSTESDYSSEVVGSRKRSRLELEGKQPPPYPKHGPRKDAKVVETARGSPRENVSHTSPSVALPGHPNDDTVEKAREETPPVVQRTMTTLPDAHQSGQPADVDMVVSAVGTVGVGPWQELPHTSPSVALSGQINHDDTVGTARQGTLLPAVPRTMTTLPDKHQSVKPVDAQSKGRVLESTEMGPTKEVPSTPPSAALPGNLNHDGTVETAREETLPPTLSRAVITLPDEHQSGEPIEAETEVDVVEIAGRGPMKEVFRTSTSSAPSCPPNDNTVGAAPRETPPVVPRVMTALPEEHSSGESVEAETKVDVVETAGRGCTKEVSHTSPSAVLHRPLNDNTVGTAPGETPPVALRAMTTLLEECLSEESESETEVDVGC